MKYVAHPAFEEVSSALTFETEGLYLLGSCDLYITKASKVDKKLYAQIDADLQARHQALLRLAAAVTPQSEQFSTSPDISRASPFGSLTAISNRRVFAYLIATLNASHPDYDFSHVTRPTDFVRERRINDVMSTINEKVLSTHGRQNWGLNGATTPGGGLMWGPEMWQKIDEEMDLLDCQVYKYQPKNNPLDDDEPAKWSLQYFFFNKRKKRVCYMYLRATNLSYYELDGEFQTPKRKSGARESADFSGAAKRARYWFGDSADIQNHYEDEDDVIQAPGDDEVDADIDPDMVDDIIRGGRSLSPYSEYSGESEDPGEVLKPRERRKSDVRAVSEGIAEAMEV